MFGFHWPELLIVLILAALVFGPKRLPEIGNMLGRGMREGRKHMDELDRETGIRDVRELGKKELADLKETGRSVADDLSVKGDGSGDKAS